MLQITPHTLQAWTKSTKTFTLLDVRTDEERKEKHIGGLHIPLHTLTRRIAEIPHPHPIIVYCAHGVRSQFAIQRIQSLLPPNTLLYNLQGGLAAIEAYHSKA